MGRNGASVLAVDPERVSVQEADIQTGSLPFSCRSGQRSDSIAFPKCRGPVPPAACWTWDVQGRLRLVGATIAPLTGVTME